MYGGPGKIGRGATGGNGGRGGAAGQIKRNFQSSSLTRPSTAPAAGGSNRNRSSSTSSVVPSSGTEESFSLVTGNPLNYAMIIKLTPDLVEEIKRVEAQGGAARIKFDANSTNPLGNVIDVGGKGFRFTWAHEVEDLLDIYEERQSGDDGNGLLVERGTASRKVNVQRVLDESTKNHVKMRSEEAERKQKSRRAIVLDHGNPSVKNQVKALAGAEVNQWRFNQKNELPKKRKAETLSVGGPPKSASKSGSASSAPPKVRPSTSPLLSTPDRTGRTLSPFRTGSLSMVKSSVENITLTQAMNKENASDSKKELYSGGITEAVQDKLSYKDKLGVKPTDLRSLLVSILIEKPGMNLKALQKAIGDTAPSSVRQIEPVLKEIADFQAPGRYFLKPGVDLDTFKKPSPHNGSSTEGTHQKTVVPPNNFDQVLAQELSFSSKHDIKAVEEQEQLNSRPIEELNHLERIVTQHRSPDLFGEKKVFDNSEGPAGSSSVSGSDSSDSDTSDSGSDSGSASRSKSRSPVGSGSGSSSDSESDSSSNSKEGSDEDVDIMSDDDKEPRQLSEHIEHDRLTSSIPGRDPEGELVQSVVDGTHDGHDSDIVEIDKVLPDDEQYTENDVVNDSFPSKGGEKTAEETKNTAPGFHEHQAGQVHNENLYREREHVVYGSFHSFPGKGVEKPAEETNITSHGFHERQVDQVHNENRYRERENVVNDSFHSFPGKGVENGAINWSKNAQVDVFERTSKSKSKRVSDGKNSDGNPEPQKRSKAESLNRPQNFGGRNSLSSESPYGMTPERYIERAHKDATIERTSRAVNDANNFGSKKGRNLEVPTKSISDSPMSVQRSTDLNTRIKASSSERPDNYAEGSGGSMRHSGRSFQMHDGQEGVRTNEKRPKKKVRLGSAGDNHSDSHYRKHGELTGKFKETGHASNTQFGYSPRDNNRMDLDKSPVANGRGSMLRRELSDLELGELRKPLPEETSVAKSQFEKKGSFKLYENKSASDYLNSDSNKGNPGRRTSADASKASPSRSNILIPTHLEPLSKERTPEPYAEDSTRFHHKAIQSQAQQQSRSDHVELGFQNNNVVERSSKVRRNEAGAIQGNGVEGYGDTQTKVPAGTGQQQDMGRGAALISAKEDKRKKSYSLVDTNEKRKDLSLSESNDDVLKRRESSSDENSSSFSKYEKEAAELKGPIKDFSQYKEYVQEYREKYDCYCSLNTILESYRSDFLNMGRDLELAKERNKDEYSMISRQMMESYRRFGTKHKRLKKIFIVLHEELQSLKQMIKDYAVSYNKD